MTKLAKIVTASGACIIITGEKPFNISREHKLFPAFLEALNKNDILELKKLINIANSVNEYVANTKLIIKNGTLYYDGEPLSGLLVDRILQLMAEKQDANNLIKFLDNLLQNPSKQSVDELYIFLEHCGDLPITEDGRFIAYKWVQDNYTDVHTGKFDNSVGKIISMPRNKVDDDRSVTCSTGLHVCSSGYTKFGPRLMLVAVNPRDVVSVPDDYNNAKMRVCEYEVVDEIDADAYTQGFKTSVYKR
jgi:hypothetical protein